MLDMTPVLVDLQTQLTALTRAMESQQATIDALTDVVIDLLADRDDRP